MFTLIRVVGSAVSGLMSTALASVILTRFNEWLNKNGINTLPKKLLAFLTFAAVVALSVSLLIGWASFIAQNVVVVSAVVLAVAVGAFLARKAYVGWTRMFGQTKDV